MRRLVELGEPEITNFDKLFTAVEEFQRKKPEGAVYLRGHAVDSWELVPTIGRKKFYAYGGSVIQKFTEKQESKLLHRFRRYAHAYIGRALGRWEAIFLARHHGLPVRLLDWTSNPLVALFNAVAPHNHIKENGAVWLLKRSKNVHEFIDVLDDAIDPLRVKGVRMIYPSYVSQRLVTQSGCFTIHGYPWTDLVKLDLSKINPKDLDIVKLKKLLIPAKDNKAILADKLMRSAISSRTIFPDLDGLSRGLVELEAIRKYG